MGRGVTCLPHNLGFLHVTERMSPCRSLTPHVHTDWPTTYFSSTDEHTVTCLPGFGPPKITTWQPLWTFEILRLRTVLLFHHFFNISFLQPGPKRYSSRRWLNDPFGLIQWGGENRSKGNRHFLRLFSSWIVSPTHPFWDTERRWKCGVVSIVSCTEDTGIQTQKKGFDSSPVVDQQEIKSRLCRRVSVQV